jgi:dCTP diphosphatase
MPSTAVLEALATFVEERDWAQFHSGANLAKSVAIESGELLELFQWTEEAPRQEVAAELADVLSYCYLLAMKLDLDPDRIVLNKLEQTRAKYPVEKARGRSEKYDQLPD